MITVPTELVSEVAEDDPGSLQWATRRDFVEIGRSKRVVLDLDALEPPPIAPPDGIEIAQWSDRPGIEAGLYAVYCEAEPDIPGEETNELASLEDWLSADMQGVSDRADAVFVAFAGDDVVGFAKLSILGSSDATTAFHDLTGVLRAWRGRGIAGALKRAQIAWAKENGFLQLATANEERNAPDSCVERAVRVRARAWADPAPRPAQRRLTERSICRCASRSAIECRLSTRSLPRASAISSLTRPSLK